MYIFTHNIFIPVCDLFKYLLGVHKPTTWDNRRPILQNNFSQPRGHQFGLKLRAQAPWLWLDRQLTCVNQMSTGLLMMWSEVKERVNNIHGNKYGDWMWLVYSSASACNKYLQEYQNKENTVKPCFTDTHLIRQHAIISDRFHCPWGKPIQFS